MGASGWDAYVHTPVECDQLLRTVEVGRRAGSVVIDRVEFFADAVRVHSSDDGESDGDRLRLDLSDDQGTRYRRGAGGHSTAPDVEGRVGHTVFSPPLPPTASALTVAVSGEAGTTFNIG